MAVEQRLLEQIEAAALRSERATAVLGERVDAELAAAADIEQAAALLGERVTAELEELNRREASRMRKTGKAPNRLLERLERVERILDAGSVIDAGELARELALAAQGRRRSVVEVRQPLVLTSQIHRSGGTLLAQLFDCHPQCHAHPYELKFGPPGPKRWPRIALDADPAEWWEALHERPAETHFLRGYHKSLEEDPKTYPFLLVPALARQLFEDLVRSRPVESARDVLDAHMTAYFNSWLDNQNLYGPDKRWIVAFAPSMLAKAEDREAFFHDYPDGRLICIVREPKGWYLSALAHHRRSPLAAGMDELATAVELWRASTEASVAAKRDYGDRVLLVRFETLVRDTRSAMAAITSFLDIELPEIALVPTFNGSPIKADSSFAVRDYGVLQEPASRGSTLDRESGEQIDELVGSAYEDALTLAI